MAQSILSIKQDVKLLSKNIVLYGGYGVKAALDKHGVKSEEIDYFLPHMSSEFFKDKIYQQLIANGTGIMYDKWFVNLSQVGNVGAASVYLMVDELFHSGKLKKGDRIFLLFLKVPGFLICSVCLQFADDPTEREYEKLYSLYFFHR